MKNKKQLAAKIMGVSPKKVKFAVDALEDIKKAITRSDMRGLIAVKKVVKSTKNQHSRAGARKIAAQKKKGRQKGKGTKKGSKYSVVSRKSQWIAKIRAQRDFLKTLKTKGLLQSTDYRNLYRKCSGGYFRNRRHIKLYITEHNLVKKENKE